MNKSNWILILSLSSISSTAAWAAPTAFPKNPGELLAVKNPTTSTLMGDTEDPRMVYVMPPTAGYVSATQVSGGTSNMGFCGEMADLQGISRQIVGDLKN